MVLAWALAEHRSRSGGVKVGRSSRWSVLAISAIGGYILLMSYPTEVVHYLQYGILAVLFGYVTRRVGASFVLTTCAGMLDEAYQYWWLHRSWGIYYDFNDVLLNIIAAGLGLAVVVEFRPGLFGERDDRAAARRARRDEEMRVRTGSFSISSLFAAVVASLRDTSISFGFLLLVLFAIGVWTGLVALQAADVQDHTWLLLNRMKPFETFWDTWGGTAKAHHIVRPWPGVMLTGLMTIVGVRLVEGMRRTERGERSKE